ncbi:MAG TPA: hypothetical protein VJX23_10695 [Candidatus Binataceae bacterium]|nr:hypothetical protein [Candidatus Binataceae bacterium]
MNLRHVAALALAGCCLVAWTTLALSAPSEKSFKSVALELLKCPPQSPPPRAIYWFSKLGLEFDSYKNRDHHYVSTDIHRTRTFDVIESTDPNGTTVIIGNWIPQDVAAYRTTIDGVLITGLRQKNGVGVPISRTEFSSELDFWISNQDRMHDLIARRCQKASAK